MSRGWQRLAQFGLCIVAGCTNTQPAPSVLTAADSLRGTWRIMAYPDFLGSENVALEFGRTPIGYLVYDETGHVFWQVLRRSAMDSLTLGRQRNAPDSVLYRLSKGFRAQFGTYQIDLKERTVTHSYEGESDYERRGFEVATPFRFIGDSLFIGADTLTWLRFIRVR